MQNSDHIVTEARRSLKVQSTTSYSDAENEITVSRIEEEESQNIHGPVASFLFCKQ